MATAGQGDNSRVNFVQRKLLEEQFLYCDVCYEEFDQHLRSPRLLPCHHRFCLHCLFSLFDSDKVQERRLPLTGGRRRLKCPQCRTEHTLREEEISQLPTDTNVINVMDILSATDKEPKNVCREHSSQALNFFCKTCFVPVCDDCRPNVLSKDPHLDHDVIDVVEALNDFLPLSIQTTLKLLPEQQARLNNIDLVLKELIKSKQEQTDQINRLFANYQVILDKRKKELLSQLDALVGYKEAKMKSQKESLSRSISIITKLHEEFEKAQNQYSVWKIFICAFEMKEWEHSSAYLAKGDVDDSAIYRFVPSIDSPFKKEVAKLGYFLEMHTSSLSRCLSPEM